MGPLIDLRQRDRVEGYVQSALDEGARIVCGGLARRDSTEARSTSPHCSPTSRPRCGWLARRSSAPCSSPSPTTTTMTPCVRERLDLWPFRACLRRRRRAGACGRSSYPHRHDVGQRRRLVLRRCAVRRLPAIRHRTRNGCRRLRGVPGDQGTRPTSTRKCTMTVHGYIGLGMMGSAMCERLARSGAAVLAHDLNPAAVDAAVERGDRSWLHRGGRRAGRHHQHVCPRRRAP